MGCRDEQCVFGKHARPLTNSGCLCFSGYEFTAPPGAVDNEGINRLRLIAGKLGRVSRLLMDNGLDEVLEGCPRCEYDEAEGVILDHCDACCRVIATAAWALVSDARTVLLSTVIAADSEG